MLLSLGLYIIPARRKHAKQAFTVKMEELRTRLRTAMTEQFHKELTSSITRVQEAITPYTRFVRSEQRKTAAVQEQLERLNISITTLKNEIDTL